MLTRITNSLSVDSLINPQSVAIIGASARENRLTSRPVRFLQQQGYKGKIYPVTPTRDDVFGIPAIDRVASLPDSVDFAYILRDSDDAVAIFKECAEKGINTACILAGGFSEVGVVGTRRQNELEEVARQYDIRLIGPNSTGIINTHNGFCCTTNAAFENSRLMSGDIAVISQSGSLIGTLLSRGEAIGVGFSVLASVGNEANTTLPEIGKTLLDDPNTKAFSLIIETIRDTDNFREFAELAYRAGKPMYANIIGQSEEGKSLTSTHTGAITGATDAIRSFLKSCGVHCTDSLESVYEAPAASLHLSGLTSKPESRSVTVVSTTGGGGTILVDKLSEKGVELKACSADSRDDLAAQNIPINAGKLIDVTMAGANPETLSYVLQTLATDDQTDILLLVIGSSARSNPQAIAEALGTVKHAIEKANKTLLAFPLPDALDCLRHLNDAGIPCFRTAETCAEFVSSLACPVKFTATPVVGDDFSNLELPNCALLNELESLELFESIGLPKNQRFVVNDINTVPSELPFSFPCAAKIISRELPHKTDVGGVILNIENTDRLKESMESIMSSVIENKPDCGGDGILIQPMHSGVCELLLGFHRDPVIGPMVTVAMGGVLTELYKDRSTRPAPISEASAREMLSELKAYPLLTGYRHSRLADQDALCECIACFSKLALIPSVKEAEINPLLVKAQGNGVVLLDALVRTT